MPRSRLALVRSLLRAKKCTHILVSDVIDVRYICGFHASNAFLLISRSEARIFSDFRYREAALAFCASHRPWKFTEIKESSFSFLKPLMPERSAMGVQSESLTVDQLDKIRAVLPGARIVKLTGAVAGIGMAKTPAEVASVARAARIGDRALRRTVGRMRAGMSETRVRDILEEECRRGGSARPSFDTIVLFGARCALPHGEPSSRRLRCGDWVLFDFGCTVDGLCSDMTRTFVAGRATGRQRTVYDIVRKAQDRGRKAIAAGMRCASVDGLVRGYIADAGHGEHFGHATGHGVGYRIHETPRLAAKNEEPLRAGTIVTVEPGIYIPDFGGVRIEDMVYLGARTTRVLTAFPRNLIEINL